ncbi:MAG: hypothetical protein HY833_01100 [Candidatus Aenigmarchaeota archaeon]|nr:hypothetical protein [Candidatus Aenigmarchaeota archaeon]
MKVHGAGSVFALAVAFSFLLTPTLVAAQYYGSNQIVDFIWVKTFGFETSWLQNPNELITKAILPTIAIYAIFLGLLRTLRLFQGMGSMEHLISAIVCLSAMFMGWVGWISGAMAVLGVWSIVIFFALMIVGGVLYSIGFIKRTKYAQIDSVMKIYDHATKKVNKQISREDAHIARLGKMMKKLSEMGEDVDSSKFISMRREMAMWKMQRKESVEQLNRIQEDFASLPADALEEKKK